MSRGLLLFAHGARDPRWAAPFQEVTARVAIRRTDARVVLAFLEFMEPDLATAGRSLVLSGCTVVDVLPLFLGAGGHVRKDVPELLDQLRLAYPTTAWHLHPAVGASEAVISAMADTAVALGTPGQ